MRIPDQSFLFSGRVIGWFSCGAASAVACKFGLQKWGDKFQPVYCDTFAEEHPDNPRFMRDVEQWIGRKIEVIASGEYRTPSEVFEITRYMSGPAGARCTTELKKQPRLEYCAPYDTHCFGFTADEQKRINEFEQRNPELILDWVLRDRNISKQDCYQILSDAGIELPAMYLMGYPHNNCIGCVKAASAGYWNKVRRDFPAMFQSRAEQSRRIGCRLVKVNDTRIFLDELDPTMNGNWKDEVISCGPDCASPVGQVGREVES